MSSEADVLDEVPPELVRRVEAALAEDRAEDVRTLLASLSATGQASVLEQVSEAERDKLVGILKRDIDPEALTELDEEVLGDVLDQLDSKDIAAAGEELTSGDNPNIKCVRIWASCCWPANALSGEPSRTCEFSLAGSLGLSTF